VGPCSALGTRLAPPLLFFFKSYAVTEEKKYIFRQVYLTSSHGSFKYSSARSSTEDEPAGKIKIKITCILPVPYPKFPLHSNCIHKNRTLGRGIQCGPTIAPPTPSPVILHPHHALITTAQFRRVVSMWPPGMGSNFLVPVCARPLRVQVVLARPRDGSCAMRRTKEFRGQCPER
jgi:hypothetical protein